MSPIGWQCTKFTALKTAVHWQLESTLAARGAQHSGMLKYDGLRNTIARLTKARHYATHSSSLPQKDCTTITPPYARLLDNLKTVKRLVDRPLTLAEKILYSHIHEPERTLVGKGNIRGEYLQLRPERIAMQDASAQCVIP